MDVVSIREQPHSAQEAILFSKVLGSRGQQDGI